MKTYANLLPASLRKLLILISLFIFILSGGLFIFVKTIVQAQIAGQGLEISPPSQEVRVDPGKTVIVKAKIRNPSNKTLPIQVHIEDFTAKGEEGQVALTADSPYSVAHWTQVSPTSFQLAPGSEQEVTATITAPKDAAGGHFGSFVFAVGGNNTGTNTAAVAQEIASLFLVRINGPVNENLTFSSFSAPSYSEFGPVPLSMKFQNHGNVYVKTFGLINVTDMFGRKVADIVVPGTNIFPQADRIVTSSLNKRFLFGKYTATALMYYGGNNQTITAITTFFVFPTRIVVGILVILLIVFLMRKRLKKAAKALAGK